MKKKLAIWGWWQGNNLGDNWIKSTLAQFFPDADFIPTSIHDFSGYNYVICGGGGLFIYDVINPFKNIDIGVPYGILGMGAEFEHSSNLTKELEKKADFFFARDKYSLKCMHLSTECRSFDVTFLNPLPVAPKNISDNNTVFFVWRDGKELISNDKFADYIGYTDVAKDWAKCLEADFDSITYDDFQTDDDDILSRIGKCSFVVSGRYHGIVAAIQRGIPFIAIDICPKIRALTEECHLSEYCVKISEIDKIHDLIEHAKCNISKIQKNEAEYVKNANLCLTKQILHINHIIYKQLYAYKILHYGSYWMGENDVVNVMADDLCSISDTQKIDLKAYSANVDNRIEKIEKTPNGTVCTLNTHKILSDIDKYDPNVLIFNSGGLCISEKLASILRSRGIRTIGISLSDPDVYPYNGYRYAKDFDIFYTNSKWSYENQYDKKSINIHIMPFAASVDHHYYMPDVEKKYDLVVVGHAREDRIPIVNELKKVCNVGLYGSGWEGGLGIVNGRDHTRAINSGKMYLSFSHTAAGYDNVKVGLFEAMACRQLVITSYMDELNEYFEIGREIVCYHDINELTDLVQYYLEHETEREMISLAGYSKFMIKHTYQKRWATVFKDINDIKGKIKK